jgi:uncharacterized protein
MPRPAGCLMITGMVDKPTFLVRYRYVPEMESRRAPHRTAHLEWLRRLADAGKLVLAGATLEPVDTGLLIFRAEDAYAVRRMLLDDPYAHANLIVSHTVRSIGLAVGG